MGLKRELSIVSRTRPYRTVTGAGMHSGLKEAWKAVLDRSILESCKRLDKSHVCTGAANHPSLAVFPNCTTASSEN